MTAIPDRTDVARFIAEAKGEHDRARITSLESRLLLLEAVVRAMEQRIFGSHE